MRRKKEQSQSACTQNYFPRVSYRSRYVPSTSRLDETISRLSTVYIIGVLKLNQALHMHWKIRIT